MQVAIPSNGSYIIADHAQAWPDTSFPASGPNAEFLSEQGAYPVIDWLAHDPDTQRLAPITPTLIDGSVVTVEVQQIPADETAARIAADYTARLEALFDSKAQERRYDNRLTCALRAGYAGPFHAEGEAFAQWMDACNAHGYTVMAAVQAGTRPLPTWEELQAELPAAPW